MKTISTLSLFAMAASSALAQYKIVNGSQVECYQYGSWCFDLNVIVRCEPGYSSFGDCADELSGSPDSPSAECKATGTSSAVCYIPSNPPFVENTYTTSLASPTTFSTVTVATASASATCA